MARSTGYWVAALFWVALAGGGCTGSGTGAGGDAGPSPEPDGSVQPARTDARSGSPDSFSPGEEEAGAAEWSPEGGGGVEGREEELPVVEVPAGTPCNDNDDCGFGYCIPGPGGSVCTHTCIKECPEGWSCQGVSLYGNDVEYICVPAYFDLCAPCKISEKCGGEEDHCLDFGEEGTFCGSACGSESGCPANFTCVEGVTAEGVVVKHCRPLSGSCLCREQSQGVTLPCAVSNEFGSCAGLQVCLGDEGWSDCDAQQPEQEACDGQDDDCDGAVDEGFPDLDGDGLADCIDLDIDGDETPDLVDNCPLIANPDQKDFDGDQFGDLCDEDDDNDGALDGVDCDSLNDSVFPGADEECDGSDNNCNGQVDEGYSDFDKDGLADCIDPDDDNDNDPDATDCKPLNPNVFSGSLEACDGLDNNCNGKIDEGFKDLDKDGKADCVDEDSDNDGNLDVTDCAPFNPAIYLGAIEICDGFDNNCNGQVDEGYPDFDKDGQGDCVDLDDDNDGDPDATDCAPLDLTIHKKAKELCDGIDNNCNGKVDEGYPDTDGDGEVDCVDNDDDNDGYPDIIDCAPLDPLSHPGEVEKCDGADNDCDGLVDEIDSVGCTTFFKDKDDDGFGLANKSLCLCGPTEDYSATQPGDCDDTSASINPDGIEVCNNKDDDCDSVKDNVGAVGCKPYFADPDGDSYGSGAPLCICWSTSSYSAVQGGDCDEGAAAIHPGAQELCDNIDNNCNGQIDEEVGSSCGNCDPDCHLVSVGPAGDEGYTLDETNSSGVSLDPNGFLQLDSEEIKLAFIWIANSGENTVSKLDTDTGKETGRYNVCSNPSRTSVDLYSDVWAACRGDGGVAKILAYEKNCVDSNKNGVIDTSRDLNKDGKISAAEMMPVGKDECVKFVVYPGGSCQRAAGVDAENNAWIGEWNGSVLRRLHQDDGKVLDSISIGCNPYGLVIDGNGIIWVSGRGCNKMIRVDPKTKDVQHLTPPTGNLYGITVDGKGRLWLGHYSDYRLSRYDPATNSWASTTSQLSGKCPRGVAAATNGHVYFGLGCGGNHWVAKVHEESLGVSLIDLGAGDKTTVGVAMDSSGFLWAVNYATSNATKINTTNDQIVGHYPVGSYPYTYSDMTGYAAKNYTAPQGYYQHIIPGAMMGQSYWTSLLVDVNCQGESYVKIRLRAADTVTGLAQAVWKGPFGPFPPNLFPMDLSAIPELVGKYLQVEVILVADEDGNSALLKGFKVQYYTK